MMGRVDRLEKLKTCSILFTHGAKRLSLLHVRAEHVRIGLLVLQFPRRVQRFSTPRTAARQAACPSPSPGVCSSSCPLDQWCQFTKVLLKGQRFVVTQPEPLQSSEFPTMGRAQAESG